jgi:hypothetical protein
MPIKAGKHLIASYYIPTSPQCPPCYYWNGSDCIYGCDPDRCETCKQGVCKSTCDSDNCERCNGSGSCESTCDPNQCEQCDGQGNCESKCDPNKCEECDGQGNCVSTCRECDTCIEGICFCFEECCEDADCTSSCQECVNCNCVLKQTSECAHWSDCEPCYDCVNCQCENLCSSTECCDNQICVPKCNPNGDCYFNWPPVEVPGTGCTNTHPKETHCAPGMEGAVCAWVASSYYLTSAECASCAPGCRTLAGACVQLTPWLCHNEYLPPFSYMCVCNDSVTGSPQNGGQHYECIQ